MNIFNIAMIAADTSRTKCYLRELINNELLPNYILVLLSSSESVLPGQKENDTQNELLRLIEESNINYDISPNMDINSKEVCLLIRNRPEDVFIFSGYGGVLLKDEILNSGKKFLHIHGGYLPDYKGSTTNYYSLLDENKIGASAIFLTKEIDSGPVLLKRKFPSPKDRIRIDHFYDAQVRSKVLIECLQNYLKSKTWNYHSKNNSGGEVFYIIHPILKHIAILSKERIN